MTIREEAHQGYEIAKSVFGMRANAADRVEMLGSVGVGIALLENMAEMPSWHSSDHLIADATLRAMPILRGAAPAGIAGPPKTTNGPADLKTTTAALRAMVDATNARTGYLEALSEEGETDKAFVEALALALAKGRNPRDVAEAMQELKARKRLSGVTQKSLAMPLTGLTQQFLVSIEVLGVDGDENPQFAHQDIFVVPMRGSVKWGDLTTLDASPVVDTLRGRLEKRSLVLGTKVAAGGRHEATEHAKAEIGPVLDGLALEYRTLAPSAGAVFTTPPRTTSRQMRPWAKVGTTTRVPDEDAPRKITKITSMDRRLQDAMRIGRATRQLHASRASISMHWMAVESALRLDSVRETHKRLLYGLPLVRWGIARNAATNCWSACRMSVGSSDLAEQLVDYLDVSARGRIGHVDRFVELALGASGKSDLQAAFAKYPWSADATRRLTGMTREWGSAASRVAWRERIDASNELCVNAAYKIRNWTVHGQADVAFAPEILHCIHDGFYGFFDLWIEMLAFELPGHGGSVNSHLTSQTTAAEGWTTKFEAKAAYLGLDRL